MKLSPDDVALADLGGWDPDPAHWDEYYAGASKQYNVPEQILRGIVKVESGGHIAATSEQGAEGTAQIMPGNKSWLGISNSYNPKEAIYGSAKYLRSALNRYQGNWNLTLKDYAGGPDQSKWGPKTAAYPTLVSQAAGLDIPTITVKPDKGQERGQAQAPVSGQGLELSAPDKAAIDSLLGPGSAAALEKAQGKAVQGAAPIAPVAAPSSAPTPQAATQPPANGTPTAPAPSPIPPLPAPAQSAIPMQPATIPNPQSAIVPAPTPPPPGGALSDVNASAAGPLHQYAFGSTLGFSPYLMAGIQALKSQGGPDYSHVSNLPTGQNTANWWHGLTDRYSQALDIYQNQRKNYENQSPLTSQAITLGSSLPTLMAGAEMAPAALTKLGGGNVPSSVGNMANALARVMRGQKLEQGPGLANMGLNMVGRAVGGGLVGAETGAMGSQLNPETGVGEQTGTGAKIGAAVESVLGPLAGKLQRLLAPVINRRVAEVAQNYNDLGGHLYVEQLTNDRLAKSIGSKLPHPTDQLKEFTRLVSRTIGTDVEELTPQTFASARAKIASGLTKFADNYGVNFDPQFGRTLTDIRTDLGSVTTTPGGYTSSTPMAPADNEAVRKIEHVLDSLENQALLGGSMSGKDYQHWTNFKGYLGRMMRGGNDIEREYAVRIRTALDDALERSVPASVVAELKGLRQQWKNVVVLAPLVSKASTSGVVDPKALLKRVDQVYRNYAWGDAGDIGTLAQAGQLLPSASATGGVKEGHKSWPALLATAAEAAAPAAVTHMLFRNPEVSAAVGAGTLSGVLGTLGMTGLRYRNPNFVPNLLDNAINGAPQMPRITIPMAVDTANYNKAHKGQ